jgi:hypothetical protein
VNKKIKFYPVGGLNLNPPVTGNSMVPEWYKDTSQFFKSNNMKDFDVQNITGLDQVSVSIKTCGPTFDAFTSGYYYVLQEDVFVEIDENGIPSLSWDSDVFMLIRTGNLEYPITSAYHPISYAFRMLFGIKADPGTSCLITHPLNRYDLPFLTVSGIVDIDETTSPTDIRFVLKKGFEGKIPKGTPIFQLIPFTRESWEMEIDPSITDDETYENEKRRTMLHSFYQKSLQHKKEYK